MRCVDVVAIAVFVNFFYDPTIRVCSTMCWTETYSFPSTIAHKHMRGKSVERRAHVNTMRWLSAMVLLDHIYTRKTDAQHQRWPLIIFSWSHFLPSVLWMIFFLLFVHIAVLFSAVLRCCTFHFYTYPFINCVVVHICARSRFIRKIKEHRSSVGENMCAPRYGAHHCTLSRETESNFIFNLSSKNELNGNKKKRKIMCRMASVSHQPHNNNNKQR